MVPSLLPYYSLDYLGSQLLNQHFLVYVFTLLLFRYRYRTAFLLESLKDLDEQLRSRGSRLFVVRGKPEDELPKLFREWNVTKLAFEADSEPRSLQRDQEVKGKMAGSLSLLAYSHGS